LSKWNVRWLKVILMNTAALKKKNHNATATFKFREYMFKK
jgi:hypothetical protein